MRVCAIDIGTVTTRMLVAEPLEDGGLAEVERGCVITHLGEGLAATGALAPAAMDRVAGVVERYVSRAGELGADHIVAMATSAARDASNAGAFLARLARCGVAPEVISGDREARLSFLGATAGCGGDGILVVDPGGGSTELVLGDAANAGQGSGVSIRAARSVDVGARRMTERFLTADPPTAEEIAAARAWAAQRLRPFFDSMRERPSQLITLAGTATTLVAVRDRLDPYDPERVHGAELHGGEVSDLLDRFASVPLAIRRTIVGLEPDRAPVIIGGTLVVETVLSLAGLASTVVSEHDILWGIVLDTTSGRLT